MYWPLRIELFLVEKPSSSLLLRERRYYVSYIKGIKASPSASIQHDNAFTSLESTLTSNKRVKHAHMSMASPSGTKAATQATFNTRASMAISRSWLLDLSWIWIPSYGGLLLKDAIVRKMPTSQCNVAKTISMLKELFAGTWNPRVSPYRQWTTVCQYHLYQVCWWGELCTPYKFTHKSMK